MVEGQPFRHSEKEVVWTFNETSEKKSPRMCEGVGFRAHHCGRDRLFCKASKTTVSGKASSIKHHVASQHHVAGKKEMETMEKKQLTLGQALQSCNSCSHLKGKTLPEKENVFQLMLMETFLAAGIHPSVRWNVFATYWREITADSAIGTPWSSRCQCP